MIRKGIIGDVARLMPVFEGFGNLPEIDLGPDGEMTNEELNSIDNVNVTLLPDSHNSKFVKQGVCAGCGKPEQACECVCPECNCAEHECQCEVEQNVSGSPIGSAGNSLVSEDPEPQMGSVGFKLRLTEAADAEGAVIDDSGLKQAQKLHSKNSLDDVYDMFGQFAIKPASKVKFDSDTSKPMNTVATKPLRKIPKGW